MFRAPASCSALLFGLFVACATRPGAAADRCADFELDVKRVWSQETKVRVEAKLLERWSGEGELEVARARAEEVGTRMDRFAQSWVMMRQAVCNDHFKRGLLSAEDYRARVKCLDGALQRQNTLVQAMSGGEELAADALAGLDQELQRCGA
jgi:hypothetical protein